MQNPSDMITRMMEKVSAQEDLNALMEGTRDRLHEMYGGKENDSQLPDLREKYGSQIVDNIGQTLLQDCKIKMIKASEGYLKFFLGLPEGLRDFFIKEIEIQMRVYLIGAIEVNKDQDIVGLSKILAPECDCNKCKPKKVANE